MEELAGDRSRAEKVRRGRGKKERPFSIIWANACIKKYFV
jgi:hypothetical protein